MSGMLQFQDPKVLAAVLTVAAFRYPTACDWQTAYTDFITRYAGLDDAESRKVYQALEETGRAHHAFIETPEGKQPHEWSDWYAEYASRLLFKTEKQTFTVTTSAYGSYDVVVDNRIVTVNKDGDIIIRFGEGNLCFSDTSRRQAQLEFIMSVFDAGKRTACL